MMPFEIHVRNLRKNVAELEHDAKRVLSDFMSGRIDVITCNQYLNAAHEALDLGDLERAKDMFIEAQAAYIRALCIQVPHSKYANLSKRPAVGGRPSKADLAVQLYLAAEEYEGGIAERCRAAMEEVPYLKAAFGLLKDGGLREAYHRGRKNVD